MFLNPWNDNHVNDGRSVGKVTGKRRNVPYAKCELIRGRKRPPFVLVVPQTFEDIALARRARMYPNRRFSDAENALYLRELQDIPGARYAIESGRGFPDKRKRSGFRLHYT